uniref:TFIIS N-terminal domain-containing protein n=1 Tax=Trypanosoma congolense (strain IL3000) TaxID=1068625 RepID=G0UPQ7_TRYCI|nr:conserved hypothetical protein [Trypanosoma congolense IL3000]
MSNEDDGVLELLLSDTSNADGGRDDDEGFLDLGADSDKDDTGDGPTSGNSGLGAGGGTDVITDEELATITRKSDAKALSRADYKRWKKLRRSVGSDVEHLSDKKSKNKRKSRSSSHREKKEKGTKGKKRSDRGTKRDRETAYADELEAVKEIGGGVALDSGKRRRVTAHHKESPVHNDFPGQNDASLIESMNSIQMDRDGNEPGARQTKRTNEYRKKGDKGAGGPTRPKRLTTESHRKMLISAAVELVQEMRQARLQDELHMQRGQPPLNRVSIREKVVFHARREGLQRYLIENGILDELSTWLYDFNLREPAAFELRTAALDILMKFPVEGELSSSPTRNGDEVLDEFTGMSREHLINTDLGSAVNALRLCKNEVHENRTKAVELLARLSRAMSGGVARAPRRGHVGSTALLPNDEENVNTNAMLTWKCKDDPTVAPPFHIVRTGTEVFQESLAKPDPLDPLSYLSKPPWRPPKTRVLDVIR